MIYSSYFRMLEMVRIRPRGLPYTSLFSNEHCNLIGPQHGYKKCVLFFNHFGKTLSSYIFLNLLIND